MKPLWRYCYVYWKNPDYQDSGKFLDHEDYQRFQALTDKTDFESEEAKQFQKIFEYAVTYWRDAIIEPQARNLRGIAKMLCDLEKPE